MRCCMLSDTKNICYIYIYICIIYNIQRLYAKTKPPCYMQSGSPNRVPEHCTDTHRYTTQTIFVSQQAFESFDKKNRNAMECPILLLAAIPHIYNNSELSGRLQRMIPKDPFRTNAAVYAHSFTQLTGCATLLHTAPLL